jgi:trans-2-enoyl-CoA reductase
MEALRYSSYGSPDEVLRLVDLESDSPGSGEVAIAVLAVPIHLKDLYFMTGRPGFRLPLPAIPGNQGFGRIIDIGSAVSGYDVGDPVHVLHCEPWTQPLRPGPWRGETVVPASSVFPSVDGNPMRLRVNGLSKTPPIRAAGDSSSNSQRAGASKRSTWYAAAILTRSLQRWALML